jgi:hypothetical protein
MKSRQSNKIIQRRKQAESKRNFANSSQCYIHDQVKDHEKEEYEHVCVKHTDYPLTKFEDGKHYCLFHLPTRNKDINKFEEFFRLRLSEIKETITENENLIKNGQEPIAVSYNFEFVWFPSGVDFHGKTFDAPVFFRNATFSGGVEFGIAKFNCQAQFHSSSFQGTAIFADAHFCDGAYFIDCVFASDAYFSKAHFDKKKDSTGVSFWEAKFLKKAYFKGTRFIARTSFKEAVFKGNTYFNEAKFLNEETTLFSFVKFEQDTLFEDAEFHQDISFNSAVFGNDSDVIFRRTLFAKYASFRYSTSEDYLRFIAFQKTENTLLNFQEAAFEKSSRIQFDHVSLFPRWLIKVDSRNFVFTNIDWGENLGKESYLKIEIDGVTEDNIKLEAEESGLEPERIKKILAITFHQIAENTENNNRFEEASNFRRLAFETEWLEKKERFKNWIENLDSETNKLKKRFQDFVFGKPNKLENESILFGLLRRCFDVFSNFLYRITSGYGENPFRAFIVLLILVFLLFPFIYTRTDFQVSPKGIPLEVVVLNNCDITDEERKKGKDELVAESKKVCHKIEQRGLGFFDGEAILHSLTSVTFQDVEYRRPLSFLAELLTLLEKIFAPLQAALLALAIRRKFMR